MAYNSDIKAKIMLAEQQALVWSSPTGSDMCVSPAPSLSDSPSPSPTPGASAPAKPTREESYAILCRYIEQEAEPADFLATTQRGEIPAEMRANLFGWLYALNEHFGFDTEVFSLTADLVDSLLGRVKVQQRHLQIIGVASFLISAKMHDESEDGHPTLRELVVNSGGVFGEGDIRRMEKIILEKLNWEVRRVTPLMMLEELYNIMDKDALVLVRHRSRRLVVIPEDGEPEFDEAPDFSVVLNTATHKLQMCTFDYEFTSAVRPVVQALSVLALVTENLFGAGPSQVVMGELLDMCGVSYGELQEGMWRATHALQARPPIPSKDGHNWCE